MDKGRPFDVDDELFWSKVDTGFPQECWLWKAKTDKDGYGRVKIEGKWRFAHRVSILQVWHLYPPVVRHKCHNRCCVNPWHLTGGTQADNIQDAVLADRQARGVQNGRSKLKNEEVMQIKRSLQDGEISQAQLAREYGVDPTVIRDIKRGRIWSHVGQENENAVSTRVSESDPFAWIGLEH